MFKAWWQQWWRRIREEWSGRVQRMPPAPPAKPPAAVRCERLEHVDLTDEVSRTLFEEFAAHRASQRGEEEIGWLLMGHRLERRAVVTATLPAGAAREAGVAHIRFNADAQAVASRYLRHQDRQLVILGVVHTHPGTLRHPSKGDLHGDQQWVKLLRGREGVFGIGTAEGDEGAAAVAHQPKPHVQLWQGLRFTWYALAEGDRTYRPLPVQITLGPDLALPLHAVWETLEHHALRLERLYQHLNGLRLEVVDLDGRGELLVLIPTGAGEGVAACLRGQDVEYGLLRGDDWQPSAYHHPHVDRGLFTMLADLSAADTTPADE